MLEACRGNLAIFFKERSLHPVLPCCRMLLLPACTIDAEKNCPKLFCPLLICHKQYQATSSPCSIAIFRGNEKINTSYILNPQLSISPSQSQSHLWPHADASLFLPTIYAYSELWLSLLARLILVQHVLAIFQSSSIP